MKEKLKILDLLDRKEISAQEAEKRLDDLRESKPRSKGRVFKVEIKSSDGDTVNVKIPLPLAKLILKGKHTFKGKQLQSYDIDYDEVLALLESGMIGELVNIESADGDTVKVLVE